MAGENVTLVTEFILLGLTNDPLLRIVLFVIFFFAYMVIVLTNLTIILVTTVDSNLQYPMYFFLRSLSTLDIWLASSAIPRLMRDLLAAKKTFSFAECATQIYMSLAVGEAECILIAVMAYDRYVAICYPLHYTIIIHKSVCIKLSSGPWICGFILTIPSTVFACNLDFCGHNVLNHFGCEIPELLSLACGNISTLELTNFIIGSALLLLPVAFILTSYFRIIRAIFRLASVAARKKTFSTCGSHIMVLTLFYGSAMITYLKPKADSSSNENKMLTIFYSTVTPTLNPIIYTIRNKEVKKAIWKITRKTMYL